MSLPIIIDPKFVDAPEITQVRPSKIGQLDISETKAYKLTLGFETKLQKIFATILDAILKTGITDITRIRFDFGEPVYDYWRGAIQNAYLVGVNYTNDAHSTVPRLSDSDNTQIKKISDHATSLFFLKLDKYFRREEDIENADYFFTIQDRITQIIKESPSLQAQTVNVIEPKKVNLKPLSIDKQIDRLVTNILFMTLNIAVVQKTRQLMNLSNKDQTVALAGNIFENIFSKDTQRTITGIVNAFNNLLQQGIRGISKRISGQKTEERPNEPPVLQFLIPVIPPATKLLMWVTEMDDKVCFKYCQPLDGEKFDAADTNHPIPIISTHPNCRCRLLSVDANGNLLADV